MPDSCHILFCDSGLGGLDVAADLVAALRQGSRFGRVNLTYFNAWLKPGFAFNQLSNFPARFAALDQVMQGIARQAPDAVVFGCNTLSVIKAKNPEFTEYGFPIYDMIEPATKLFADALAAEPDSALILLGTTTTIAGKVYEEKLHQLGFDPERIIPCPCPGLATMIEYRPDGAEVHLMLQKYARLCQEKLSARPKKLFLALGCSHFGYIAPAWEEAFKDLSPEIILLNPNREVLRPALPQWCGKDGQRPVLQVRVLTKVAIARIKRENIGAKIADRAPELAEALAMPERYTDLF